MYGKNQGVFKGPAQGLYPFSSTKYSKFVDTFALSQINVFFKDLKNIPKTIFLSRHLKVFDKIKTSVCFK